MLVLWHFSKTWCFHWNFFCNFNLRFLFMIIFIYFFFLNPFIFAFANFIFIFQLCLLWLSLSLSNFDFYFSNLLILPFFFLTYFIQIFFLNILSSHHSLIANLILIFPCILHRAAVLVSNFVLFFAIIFNHFLSLSFRHALTKVREN